MLSFEQKIAIIEQFPELERKNVSLGRVNFHYEESAFEKKTVVYHLHPNGNGFVYAAMVPGYADQTDDKGFVNIREFTAEELQELIKQSIRSLTGGSMPKNKERWIGSDHQMLTVFYEDELWYVYSGDQLESAFETYDEVKEYMAEEGFNKA
jgi:hypothetical protein